MTVLEFVARTFSIQLEDGRFIFRPWGARGPCYLLSQQQREDLAWIQLLFYGSVLSGIWFFPGMLGSTSGLIIFFVTFTLFNYVLFWMFPSVCRRRTSRPYRLLNRGARPWPRTLEHLVARCSGWRQLSLGPLRSPAVPWPFSYSSGCRAHWLYCSSAHARRASLGSFGSSGSAATPNPSFKRTGLRPAA